MCVKVKFDTEIGLQMARSGEGSSCLVYVVLLGSLASTLRGAEVKGLLFQRECNRTKTHGCRWCGERARYTDDTPIRICSFVLTTRGAGVKGLLFRRECNRTKILMQMVLGACLVHLRHTSPVLISFICSHSTGKRNKGVAVLKGL